MRRFNKFLLLTTIAFSLTLPTTGYAEANEYSGKDNAALAKEFRSQLGLSTDVDHVSKLKSNSKSIGKQKWGGRSYRSGK